MRPRLAARSARGLLDASPSRRAEGAGKAGCRLGTRGPPCGAHAKKAAQRHTGAAERPAFPARWVDGLCCALPGADLPSGLPRLRELTTPSARSGSQDVFRTGLTVATTARTTQFCRTQEHRSSAHSLGFTGTTRPPRAIACLTLPASTAPHPQTVTTRDSPLVPDGLRHTYDISEFL